MVEIINKDLTPFEIAEGEAWEEQREQRERDAISEQRRLEYALHADPLYFGWQRGENSEQDWLDAVEKVRADNPYPGEEDVNEINA